MPRPSTLTERTLRSSAARRDLRMTRLPGGWDPRAHQHRDGNSSARPSAEVRQIVLHITGTTDLEKVRQRFTTPSGGASAHYLIDRGGELHQFVSEERQAWHAGIQAHIHPLYQDGSWRRYVRYFGWWKRYPADAVYLDKALMPVPEGPQAALVARADGSSWPAYGYFDARWGEGASPPNYKPDENPNWHSIGIEILSYGKTEADPEVYTEAMYATLDRLLEELCARHGLPRERGVIVGHEDVNPVGRWGWDPNQGFDWDRAVPRRVEPRRAARVRALGDEPRSGPAAERSGAGQVGAGAAAGVGGAVAVQGAAGHEGGLLGWAAEHPGLVGVSIGLLVVGLLVIVTGALRRR